ncbi:hypothetical protein DFQ30_005029 [Apophysomyces sp. BC1015]|nr:hypothetical protein DFQ30_005029 [Apophysomyces sp. BC1015]
MEYLRCKYCLIEKERETGFYCTTGHVCKECHKRRQSGKSVAEITTMLASTSIVNEKQCNKCRTTKSVGEFHKHQHVCKECYNSARRVKKAGVVEQITAPTTASEMVNVAKEHIVPTKGFGNYITALNAERYDEGFVRSSVVTFIEAMNVPQRYAHLKAATVPRNYYDYICAFYSKHKEQYDLEYPIVPEERLVTSIKYY